MKRRVLIILLALLPLVLVSPGTPSAQSTEQQFQTRIYAAHLSYTLSPVSRPPNGTILYSRIRGGTSSLRIRNGLRQDGVVALVRGRSKAIGIYVRARSRATVRNIKGGRYQIYFTTGSRFDRAKGRFVEDAAYYRFKQRLSFPPSWSLTLHGVVGGNAAVRHVRPKDFPA